MAVPTSGPWQTDQTLQQLMRGAVSARESFHPTGKATATPEQIAFVRYVNQNRERLGIPDGYYPDPTTGGQSLQNEGIGWIKAALLMGGLAAGPLVAPLFATSGPTSSVIPGTGIPVESGTVAASGAMPTAPAIASTGAATAAKTLTDKLTDPKSLATLAALGLGGASSAFGGVNGPMDDDAVSGEISKSLALQRSRVEQAQPAYDALVRMAYGMTPQSYRGAAPAGFQAPVTDNPAYQYQAPTFGRRS